MKNPDSPHPKNYTPVIPLDGVGGDLFKLDEKKLSPRRERVFGGAGVNRQE